MKELYLAQYVEAGPTVDLQLKSKQIKILSAEVDGWSCEFSDHGQEVIIMYCMFYVIIQNIQVSRKNVEQLLRIEQDRALSPPEYIKYVNTELYCINSCTSRKSLGKNENTAIQMLIPFCL